MASTKPRVKAPKKAAKGDIVEIKTLVSHIMETGLRKDKDGNLIPRQIINKFTASFNGKEFFSVDLDPAVSANPYFQFNMRAEESGKFEFVWNDDDGSTYSAESELTVA